MDIHNISEIFKGYVFTKDKKEGLELCRNQKSLQMRLYKGIATHTYCLKVKGTHMQRLSGSTEKVSGESRIQGSPWWVSPSPVLERQVLSLKNYSELSGVVLKEVISFPKAWQAT